MISKQKGDVGETRVIYEFTKRGIQVSIPYGDSARYDLIAEFNGKLNKIQVKYCSKLSSNNSIYCPCSSSTNHTTNKHLSTYQNDIDYFAFYLEPYDECVLVPISIIGDRKIITFRKGATKNNQSVNINLVQDYTFDTTLCVETLHDEPKELLHG